MRDVPAFAVDSLPTLTVGLDPPSEEYVFVDITGGGIVGDSLIVVVDSRMKRVGVYGFDGRFRRWIIREGEGPGEVESIRGSGVLPDGRVWVYDLAGPRLLAVGVGGEIISEADLPVEDPRFIHQVDVIGPGANGSWWFRREASESDHDPGTLVRIPTELLRLDREGDLETVWAGGGDVAIIVDAREMILEGTPARRTTFHRAPYLPQLHFEATGHGVLMARSDSGWVDYITGDGSRQRIGSFPTAPIPVPAEDPPEGLPAALQVVYQRARYYPEITRLLLDREGGAWIYRAPREGVGARGASDEPAWLYRLSVEGPDRSIASHHWRIATTLSRTWVLAERRHPETAEQYVSLHRLVPVEGMEP